MHEGIWAAGDEVWKDVPGYDGRYQASTCGRIRRVLRNGKTVVKAQYAHKGSGRKRLFVKLTSPDGASSEATVASIMARTFLGPCPVGHVPYHVNGMQRDNSIQNIAYIRQDHLERITGSQSRRRPAAKAGAS